MPDIKGVAARERCQANPNPVMLITSIWLLESVTRLVLGNSSLAPTLNINIH